MQAAILPLSAGWFWIQQGYRLFRRQPLAMFFWGMTMGLLITISYLFPLFGQMALIVITPMLTFVTLNACRRIAHGETMLLPMWLAPLRDGNVRGRLLKLGFAYLGSSLAGGFLAVVPFLGGLMQAVDSSGALDPEALLQAMTGPFITFSLIYVVISALFWHAPALIGWHGLNMSRALFFSMVACWRNKWPFLLYGVSWAGIFFGAQFLADLLLGIGLPPAVAQLLLTPINILVATVLYCSFYPTYVSVFGASQQDDDESPPQDQSPA